MRPNYLSREVSLTGYVLIRVRTAPDRKSAKSRRRYMHWASA